MWAGWPYYYFNSATELQQFAETEREKNRHGSNLVKPPTPSSSVAGQMRKKKPAKTMNPRAVETGAVQLDEATRKWFHMNQLAAHEHTGYFEENFPFIQ